MTARQVANALDLGEYFANRGQPASLAGIRIILAGPLLNIQLAHHAEQARLSLGSEHLATVVSHTTLAGDCSTIAVKLNSRP